METKDIELLNKILDLSKKILKIYSILFKLEIKHLKPSKVYSRYLNYLDVLLDLEDEYYKMIPIEKIDLYITYSDRGKTFITFSDYSLIINDFYDFYFAKRVYNHLKKIKDSYKISSYQKGFIKEDEFFDQVKFIEAKIENEIAKLFLYYIEQEKKSLKNNDYKNGLTSIKYILSFLNMDIEKELTPNFEINDNLYLTSQSLADLFGFLDHDYLRMLQGFFHRFLKRDIRSLMKRDLDSSDYSFENHRLRIGKALIQSYLTLDKNNIYLKDKIHDMIDSCDLDVKEILKESLEIDEKICILRSERLVLNGDSK